MHRERLVETDKSLPVGLKVIVVVNIIAVLGVGVFAYRAGGFVSGVFPPDRRVNTSTSKPQVPVAAYSGNAQRAELAIPSEYQFVEPIARRWELLPDGSVRFAN